jgi:hypothetical protein
MLILAEDSVMGTGSPGQQMPEEEIRILFRVRQNQI